MGFRRGRLRQRPVGHPQRCAGLVDPLIQRHHQMVGGIAHECEPPVGEHQANGGVERAIQDVQAQIRTMRMALQSRYKCKLRSDHAIMHWLVNHAGKLISLCRVKDDGRTAYEKRKGKRWMNIPVVVADRAENLIRG